MLQALLMLHAPPTAPRAGFCKHAAVQSHDAAQEEPDSQKHHRQTYSRDNQSEAHRQQYIRHHAHAQEGEGDKHASRINERRAHGQYGQGQDYEHNGERDSGYNAQQYADKDTPAAQLGPVRLNRGIVFNLRFRLRLAKSFLLLRELRLRSFLKFSLDPGLIFHGFRFRHIRLRLRGGVGIHLDCVEAYVHCLAHSPAVLFRYLLLFRSGFILYGRLIRLRRDLSRRSLVRLARSGLRRGV